MIKTSANSVAANNGTYKKDYLYISIVTAVNIKFRLVFFQHQRSGSESGLQEAISLEKSNFKSNE